MCTSISSIVTLHENNDHEKIVIQDSTTLLGDLHNFFNALLAFTFQNFLYSESLFLLNKCKLNIFVFFLNVWCFFGMFQWHLELHVTVKKKLHYE